MIGRRRLFFFAVAWSVFAIYGSLVPLLYHPVGFDSAIDRFTHLPPLWFGMGSRADWVANILLFIPLTFLWMGVATRRSRNWVRVIAAILIVPLGACAAVGLEFSQIWFVRTVSRNDILAETIGSILGVVIWLAFGERLTDWAGGFERARHTRSRLQWILQAYVLGFAVYSVLPLDLTISLTDIYHKYRDGRIVLVPFSYRYASFGAAAYDLISDVILFVPVGIWLAEAAREWTRKWSPFQVGILGGFAIATAIEFVQLLVLSRYTDSTDIILGTTGAALGAWLLERQSKTTTLRATASQPVSWRQQLPWFGFLSLYSLFVAAGFWYPFEITADRGLIRDRFEVFVSAVPFQSLYLTDEFNATKQLLVRLLLYAPIGVVWAYLGHRARRRLIGTTLCVVGIIHAFLLALGIEIGQILMPGKTPDSTEVALCVTGALAGLMIARRVLKGDSTRSSKPLAPQPASATSARNRPSR